MGNEGVTDFKDLRKSIDEKRKIMFITAETYGIDSQETLKCSEELDMLIVKYQKLVDDVN